MKRQAFSKHDQTEIIQTVNTNQPWEARRAGRLIRIYKTRLIGAQGRIVVKLEASVYVNRRPVKFRTSTVAEMLEDLNRRLQFDRWQQEESRA